MYSLIITTIPHYLSIFPILQYYNNNLIWCYINIIFISTSFSILYHLTKESNYTIFYIDYTLAFIWTLFDISIPIYFKDLYTFNTIISANIIIFFININITRDKNYIIHHSIWHLLSAYKCFYVSNTIKQILSLHFK
jgi:hypothetical protein